MMFFIHVLHRVYATSERVIIILHLTSVRLSRMFVLATIAIIIIYVHQSVFTYFVA